MMSKKLYIWSLVAAVCISFSFTAEARAQQDIADVPSESLLAGQDKNKGYLLIGSYEEAGMPREGFGLIIILPGGDGKADHVPFAKRIYKNALRKKYLVAQLVPLKLTAEQKIIWPTKKTPVEEQEFSTEEFVEAVIQDVRAKCKLNNNYIFTFSWSSGGPAAYAASLQKEKSVTGSFIAMSAFKPENLPAIEHAKGHAYVLFHSPTDKTCPFAMAEEAQKTLTKTGAKVKLSRYAGGHGWQEDPYGRIRFGVRWLEKNHAEPPKPPEPAKADEGRPEPDANTPTQPETPEETPLVQPPADVNQAEQPKIPEETVTVAPGPEVNLPDEPETPPEPAATEPSADTNSMFLVKLKGKFGYITKTNAYAIRPRFGRASEFSEGLACVRTDGGLGYIDKTGEPKFLLDSKVRDASEFHEGLARAAVSEGGSLLATRQKFGYIDKTGKIVIQPKFDKAGDFSEGLAAVKIGEKYGYINKSGEYAIEPRFRHAGDFCEGLAAVATDRKHGYIDKTGKVVIEPAFAWAYEFSEGLGRVWAGVDRWGRGGKYGFIDKTGTMVITPKFHFTDRFSEGLAAVIVGWDESGGGGKYGFIDKTGEVVIEPKFNFADEFSEGLAVVEIKDKYGYIDKTGKLIIEPQFDKALAFHQGWARVWMQDRVTSGDMAQAVMDLELGWRTWGKAGYIDKTGTYVCGLMK